MKPLLPVLALLVLAFAAPFERRPDVAFLHGAPYVELSLGGARCLFLVDTGANGSAVDGEWLGRSGAGHEDAGFASVLGMTGSLVARRVKFHRLQLGSGFFPDPVFNVQSFAGFAAPDGRRQTGLLGTDFLSCYALTVDHRRGRVSFALRWEREARGPDVATVPVRWDANLPTASARLGPIALPVRLDSGATYLDDRPFLDVNEATVAALRARGVALRETGATFVRGVSGPERLALLEGPVALELGPLRLEGVVLVVHGRGTLASSRAPLGLASCAILSRLGRWTLDPFDRVLVVPRGG